MLLTVDLKSEQPIYLQIRNSIVEGIASGELEDGEMLPSVRALASELGINLHTVNKAYQMLKLDGFVEILRNKGTVIKARGLSRDKKDFIEAATESLKNVVTEAITRSVSKKQLIDIIDNLYDEVKGNKS